MNATQQQLFESLAEVLCLHPDWRVGQAIANLTDRFKHPDSAQATAEAIWDIEDDELLASSRELIDRQSRQIEAPAGPITQGN